MAFAEDDIYIRTFRTAEKKKKRGSHVDRCNEYVVNLIKSHRERKTGIVAVVPGIKIEIENHVQ